MIMFECYVYKPFLLNHLKNVVLTFNVQIHTVKRVEDKNQWFFKIRPMCAGLCLMLIIILCYFTYYM